MTDIYNMSMNSVMSVAAVLTTYNSGPFITAMLESILQQTVLPDELVISDDASTDGTADRVRAFVDANAQRLRGVQVQVLEGTERLGVAGNYGRALRAASAELVAIGDHDDLWEPRHIEVMRDCFIEEPDLQVVASNAIVVDGAGAELGLTIHDYIGITPTERAQLCGSEPYRALVRRPLMTGPTMMVRRRTAVASLPIDEGFFQDEWLAFACAAVGRARLLPDVLTRYRQHASNTLGVAIRGRFGAKVDKIAALTRSRQRANRDGVARAERRLRGLERMGPAVSPRVLAHVRADLAHERWRCALPRLRVARVPAVLGAARAGRYGEFDQGLRDALRDVLAARH